MTLHFWITCVSLYNKEKCLQKLRRSSVMCKSLDANNSCSSRNHNLNWWNSSSGDFVPSLNVIALRARRARGSEEAS